MASTTPPSSSSAVLALKYSRRQIWEELAPHLIECTPDAWLTKYVRKIGEHSLDNVASNDFVKHVMKNIQNSLTQAGWFGLLAPQKGNKVDAVYSTLVNIFNDICRVALQLDSSLEQSTILESTSSTICASGVGSYQLKPHFRSYPPDRLKSKILRVTNLGRARRGDAVRAEISAQAVVQSLQDEDGPATRRDTSDTFAIGEVKWEHDPVTEDDELKLFTDATEIIYNDPCCRFIFGFTIQKDQTRLWHLNRSYICRSQKFNIHDEIGRRYLIAFLLFLCFAKHHELGIDPTVTRVEFQSESGPPVIAYQYDVEDQDDANRKSYLTEGPPISESAAYHICSRATRVWKVRQIMSTSDDGEITLSDVYHVLKDVWLCSDSKGEKAIQDDIFKRLAEVDKEKGTSHEFEARPYFVNILNDWKVKLEGTSDETPGIPSGWRPASVTRLRATFNPVASGSSRAVTSSGDIEKPSTPETTALKSRHIPRQHYWTVYGQLCQSIYEVPDYETMIRVIIGIFKALHYLFIAGYVHRDVSAGNCLWYPEGKVGKLSDLEYARPYEELSGHNSRPGTSAFMAVEYATGCPLYFQAPDSSDDDDYGYRPNDSLPFEVQSEDAQFTEVHESGDAEDVHFNFYHGIESAIWIYYWFMIHNLPKALLHEKEKFEALPAKTGLFNGDVRLRRSMLSSVTRRGAVNNHLLAAYTSPFDVLIIDISVFESLSGAYQSLAKRNPLKGGFVPKSIFRSKLYVKMRREFDVLLNQIEEKRREKVDFGSVNLSAGIADKTGKTRE